jgi:hypothetical protein
MLLYYTLLIFYLFKYEWMKCISNALPLYIQPQHLVSQDHDSTAAILNQALCGTVQHRPGYQWRQKHSQHEMWPRQPKLSHHLSFQAQYLMNPGKVCIYFDVTHILLHKTSLVF